MGVGFHLLFDVSQGLIIIHMYDLARSIPVEIGRQHA